MASTWGARLEMKLNGLADTASKESIQTYANWIGFNRKHAAVIGGTLAKALASCSSEARQWLYWQLIHELLLLHNQDSVKWERMAGLRETLGELTIVPAMDGLGSRIVADKLEPLLKQWDDKNVFGGPTLVSQIRRLLASSTTKGKKGASSSPPPAKESEDTKATAPEVSKPVKKPSPKKPADDNKKPPASAEKDPSQRRSSLSSLTKAQVEYDFEDKNVPQGKVESREFLDPCKAIATLQIVRDMRNDSAVQLSSLLTNLPKDVLEKCSAEGETLELDSAATRDFSIRIKPKLLDMDIEEEIKSVQIFRDVVQKQMAAREKLIHLLLKSRCQFGSRLAAKEFFSLEATSGKLKRRKQLLGDALELEGLDSEIDNTDYEKKLQNLSKLSWYEAGEDSDVLESASKKARVES